MPKLNSLIKKIKSDYPHIKIKESDLSHWSSKSETVFIDPNEDEPEWILLHELSHGILGHSGFEKDIELLKIERDAWEYAKKVLSPKYKIKIDEDYVQDQLDTYRDWLHKKSLCPICKANGIETKKNEYHCPICNNSWNTNTGTQKQIRRYKIK